MMTTTNQFAQSIAMTPSPNPSETPPRWSWSWAWLFLALVWAGGVRVPLVLNAGAHLDSDLAVDGLTLIDALDGHWRWHYPATPFIGSPPVLLSWVQAKIWGAGPITLVSGGVVAYGLIVVATFLLNLRAFGPSVASWGLVPLAFASTGTVWLSGRVTGGHLLTVAWHAWAFVLLWGALTKGGWRRSSLLGFWCGLGLYVDSMFAVTWAGLGTAAFVHAIFAFRDLRFGRTFACLLAFGLAAGVGVTPRFVGRWVDPHDAYVGQFEPITRPEIVARNARLLRLDCLPRLVAGHRLPSLQAEPQPSSLTRGFPSGPEKGIPWLGLAVTVVSLGLFAGATSALVIGGSKAPDGNGPARLAIRWGLLVSGLAVVAGFLVHPTITNSDNYRYLVTWLVPWSTGFGLMMAGIASKGRRVGVAASLSPGATAPHPGPPPQRREGGRGGPSVQRIGLATLIAFGFASLMTVDSARWYERFGWVDSTWRPVRKAVDDPVLAWLDAHREVSAIYGDYWDVYRLSFLTGGLVRGVPFPEYPERFPEIKASLPGGRPRVVVVVPGGIGPLYAVRALAEGGREIGQGRGFSIVDWPPGTKP